VTQASLESTPALPAKPKATPTVALIGSPNSGKTTLFNALTGLRQKVANYPGVTVEEKDGWLTQADKTIRILDLPGLYGFSSLSPDEEITQQILAGKYEHEPRPDAVLFVLDGSALHRSLGLLGSVLKKGLPSAVAVTMYDEIAARGGRLDIPALASALGVPVFPVVGHRGTGVPELIEGILANDWPSAAVSAPLDNATSRAAWSDKILEKCLKQPKDYDQVSRKIDRVVLHPILGPFIFFAVMAGLFQSIFSWAAPLMDIFAGSCSAFGAWIETVAPAGLLRDLVVHGIIEGVGGVVVFLPQIMILFFLIHLLEAIGYMARAAFLADRLMGWVGLQGRSFVALLSCHACAVPGIMATRSIPSETDRLKTMLVAPFITCSARLPVYALLIAAFVPARAVFGPLGLQGLILLSLYVAGGLAAFLGAFVLSKTTLKGSLLPFYMELPPYRRPPLKNVLLAMWQRAKIFISRAGRIILPASIILWAMLSFPRSETPTADITPITQSRQLKNSFAGRFGRLVEPIFAPAGFDWRINIGVFASLAAREVVVSTLAQIYGVENDEAGLNLTQTLQTAKDPETGRPLMTLPTALALMAFFVFALQCVSTLAIMRRETNTWRWPALAFIYMSLLAYGAAVVTFQASRTLLGA
jgi:ferrous iron transport protein B